MSVIQLNKGKTTKAITIGTAAALGITAIMMCLLSLIMLFIKAIPYPALPYIALAADAAGIFVGGYIAAAIAGSRGLINGLICGVAVFLIMLIAGFIAENGTLTIITVLKLIVLLIFGALGGIKGVNKKERLHIK